MSYDSVIAGDSPTNWWKCNDAGPYLLADSVGSYALTCQFISTPTFGAPGLIASEPGETAVKGTVAEALEFGPSTANGSISGSWSVEFWATAASGYAQNFITTRTGSDQSFDVSVTSSGGLHADIGTGSTWLDTSADYSGAGINPSTPTHVVYVVTATGYTIYINGSAVSSGSWSSAVPLLYDGTHTVSLGAQGQQVVGTLDEIAFYDYALTNTQVSNHWNAAQLQPPVNTAAPWQMQPMVPIFPSVPVGA